MPNLPISRLPSSSPLQGDELRQNFRSKLGKKILQIEAKTLTPLEIFPSIIDASEITGINRANIGHCLSNSSSLKNLKNLSILISHFS